MITPRFNYFVLILIFSFLLRLWSINSHEYWFDEKASVFLAGQPFPMLLELSRKDTHPPLYFILLKTWSAVSKNVPYLRLFSVLSGTATVGLAYLLGKQIFNKQTAMLTGVLLTLSPLHVYYSTEIRMYALFMLETLLLALLVQRLTKTPSTRTWILLIFVETLLLYTHYYSSLFIIASGIGLIVAKSGLIKTWLKIQGVAFLLFLPWVFYSFSLTKPACWCFNPLLGLPWYFASLTIGGLGLVTLKDYLNNLQVNLLLFLLIGSTVFFGFFVKGLRQHSKNLPLYLFFIPLVMASLAGFFIPVFSARSLIPGMPYFFMYVANGIYSLRPPYKQLLALTIPVLLAGILLIQNMQPVFKRLPANKDYIKTDNIFVFYE